MTELRAGKNRFIPKQLASRITSPLFTAFYKTKGDYDQRARA